MAYSLSESDIREALNEHTEVLRSIAILKLNRAMLNAEMSRDTFHDTKAYENTMKKIEGGLELMVELSLITEEERIIIMDRYENGLPTNSIELHELTSAEKEYD